MNWSPTAIGRLLTSSPQWQLSINGDHYELSVEGKTSRGGLLDLDGLVISKGFWWCRLVVTLRSGQSVVLGGLPNSDGNELRSSIQQGVSRIRRQRRAAELAQSFSDRIAPLVQWEQEVERAVQSRFKQRGWLDHDFIERQSKAKPQAFESWLDDPDVKALIPLQPLLRPSRMQRICWSTSTHSTPSHLHPRLRFSSVLVWSWPCRMGDLR